MPYCTFFSLIILASSAMLFADAQIPDKALCSVCALKGGETEWEKVKAHSEHDGRAYYFCSKDCKTMYNIFIDNDIFKCSLFVSFNS